MTTIIAEVYDALIAAGSPEDKARKAAEAVAGFESYEPRFVRIEANLSEVQRDVADLKRDVSEIKQRLSAVERDTYLLKWMVGFLLAMQVAALFKLFLH
jgi:hypothetical protein